MTRRFPQKITERPIRIGFLLIGNGGWRGGVNYQRTLLQAIAGPLAGRIEARVFVTPEQHDLAQEAFGSLLGVGALVVDERVQGAGVGPRVLHTLLSGTDRQLAALLTENNIDVIFETARFFGRQFPVPALVWIPDFQHRHLPDLFSRLGWLKRDIGFRAQSLGKRIIMLSSGTARDDCERFYPSTRGRTRVVRFSPEIDPVEAQKRVTQSRVDHDLPERFFYMPNQFWAHKNHTLVLEALAQLRARGGLECMPPIVMSGPTSDHRNSDHYTELIARAEAEGLLPWFRHLGLIPMADVLALNAGALALLNPSLFEGWASSVEEAKALGSPLILSDIPVHREQAPGAQFFDVGDASKLAELLYDTAEKSTTRETDLATLMTNNAERKWNFTNAFETAIRSASKLYPH
jgi:glycosyltransferase involved in cell wall biosynthesis